MSIIGVNHSEAVAAAGNAEEMAEAMATLPSGFSVIMDNLYDAAWEVQIPLVDFDVEARRLISIAAENAENLARDTSGSADEIVHTDEEAADEYSAVAVGELGEINFF